MSDFDKGEEIFDRSLFTFAFSVSTVVPFKEILERTSVPSKTTSSEKYSSFYL